ncbi:M81 family peptidase [Rhizobium leguminosarum]|uniref:Microcystinase C n=1 Tax=Rhizobium johnstonii (strain DSM 114642 / LMG 32736 / 3841) TaxID=216596 RepID=Q1MAI2_RHIJ3|nr:MULTISPECIES: M81 family metallopeptidase [Rhizobium]MBB4508766.1 microcystin degradation protein MlrC [Rhizobium leguminosarum]MBY5377562.1 M81 family metallopeptidase [Rhizobium leguminosarum]MBY5418305.1 M81 family metallopeptidase [Rhizobium leguminosarum]NEI57148.1 microcystin degradation protein MlrC [Rhizobium leguminosarum]NEI85996.1 microcystin degradation protein MlrC [Rhizobium leguminosarum]
MRIAVGGIHTECSTYNPVLNEEKDFRVVRGEALLASPYFAFLKDYDAEFLPTIHARAIAGGPVSRATYEAFKGEFLERLKPMLPLDGLYLAMHGAMYVEGMEDAEGDWIGAARAAVGEDCTVSASYDLHGNVTQRIIDALDIYSTYRTAPHIDVEETMRRSVSMLVKSLKTGERPTLLWAPIPVVLPGERTSTVDEPAKSLYDMLPGIDAIDGVWDASLMVGYVWADEPRATAAAIMTGTDRAVLEREAKRLARAYWNAREDFVFGCETGSLEECVEKAIASPTAPVVLAESGDNPTGGGVGDRADVLAELIAREATGVVFAGIADKAATEACYAAGIGAELELSVGASLDNKGSKPVIARFTVKFLHETSDPTDRQAVVSVSGIDLVLSAKRRPYHNIADFTRLGLDAHRAKIIVVKSGYLSPELAPIANPNLMALSTGVVDQFVERLPRLRKQHPTYPFDKDFAFEPQVFLSARSTPA